MKIKSIKKREKAIPTWDLEVDDVHHYVLGNGCVSHNTSQILGNSECFEPFASNIFKRLTLSGEFIQINKHLVNDLIELELWNDNLRQKIIANNGSIQNIDEIPDDIKVLYRTVWEMSQKTLIDLAAGRAPFVCQSQSMNLFFENINVGKLTSAYFYAWEKGLKTIVYYTRSRAAREAIKFTVDVQNEEEKQEELLEGVACSLENPEACEMCGS